jgi:hypothetical protein
MWGGERGEEREESGGERGEWRRERRVEERGEGFWDCGLFVG